MKHRLILKSFQSPGDIVMLTAAVRDLHAAYPGRFQTDVRTSANAIWENNPHLTPLDEHESDVAALDMHYPLVHQSNQRPYHFLHGYTQYLEQQLDLRIPVTQFRGDIHLSEAEKEAPPLAGFCSQARQSLGLPSRDEKETSPLAGELPGSSLPAASTTSQPSGGTRRAIKRSSITSAIVSRSCNAVKRSIGIHD